MLRPSQAFSMVTSDQLVRGLLKNINGLDIPFKQQGNKVWTTIGSLKRTFVASSRQQLRQQVIDAFERKRLATQAIKQSTHPSSNKYDAKPTTQDDKLKVFSDAFGSDKSLRSLGLSDSRQGMGFGVMPLKGIGNLPYTSAGPRLRVYYPGLGTFDGGSEAIMAERIKSALQQRKSKAEAQTRQQYEESKGDAVQRAYEALRRTWATPSGTFKDTNFLGRPVHEPISPADEKHLRRIAKNYVERAELERRHPGQGQIRPLNPGEKKVAMQHSLRVAEWEKANPDEAEIQRWMNMNAKLTREQAEKLHYRSKGSGAEALHNLRKAQKEVQGAISPVLGPAGRALGYLPGPGQLAARVMGHDPSKYLEEALPSTVTEIITAPLVFGADIQQWSDSNSPWTQRFLALGEGASQFVPGEEILLKGGSKLVKGAWNRGMDAVQTAKNVKSAGILGKVDAASPLPSLGRQGTLFPQQPFHIDSPSPKIKLESTGPEHQSLHRTLKDGKAPISPPSMSDVTPTVARANDAKFSGGVHEPTFQYKMRSDTRREQYDLARKVMADYPAEARTATGSVLYRAIAKDFKTQSGTQLVGKHAPTSKDLAVAAQFLRDPRFETFRVVFMKGNEILDQVAFSQRLPGSSRVFDGPDGQLAPWIEDHLKAKGADGFYLLHNHPSGHPRPSKSDINSLKNVMSMPQFKSHVVIDSNKFAVIDRHGNVLVKKAKFHQGRDPVRPQGDPVYKMRVDPADPQSLARLAMSALREQDSFALIGIDKKMRITTAREVPVSQLHGGSKATDQVKAYRLAGFASETGSDAFYVVIDPVTWHKLGRAGQDKLIRAQINGLVTDVIDHNGVRLTPKTEPAKFQTRVKRQEGIMPSMDWDPIRRRPTRR